MHFRLSKLFSLLIKATLLNKNDGPENEINYFMNTKREFNKITHEMHQLPTNESVHNSDVRIGIFGGKITSANLQYRPKVLSFLYNIIFYFRWLKRAPIVWKRNCLQVYAHMIVCILTKIQRMLYYCIPYSIVIITFPQELTILSDHSVHFFLIYISVLTAV